MRKLLIPILMAVVMLSASACSQGKTEEQKSPEKSDNFVLVKGGTFVNTKSNFYGKSVKIPDFYIGKYETCR